LDGETVGEGGGIGQVKGENVVEAVVEGIVMRSRSAAMTKFVTRINDGRTKTVKFEPFGSLLSEATGLTSG